MGKAVKKLGKAVTAPVKAVSGGLASKLVGALGGLPGRRPAMEEAQPSEASRAIESLGAAGAILGGRRGNRGMMPSDPRRSMVEAQGPNTMRDMRARDPREIRDRNGQPYDRLSRIPEKFRRFFGGIDNSRKRPVDPGRYGSFGRPPVDPGFYLREPPQRPPGTGKNKRPVPPRPNPGESIQDYVQRVKLNQTIKATPAMPQQQAGNTAASTAAATLGPASQRLIAGLTGAAPSATAAAPNAATLAAAQQSTASLAGAAPSAQQPTVISPAQQFQQQQQQMYQDTSPQDAAAAEAERKRKEEEERLRQQQQQNQPPMM